MQPDFLCLAKGMTGGYLPMAATLTTQKIFDAFLGGYDEFKTFFHGHSYTANQLGAAASLASLEILQSPESVRSRQALEKILHEELQALWSLPNVGDIRQVGLIAGIELVKNWRTREAVCVARTRGHPRLRSHGQTRRAHAARRQRDCPDAAVLRHPRPSQPHGRRLGRQYEDRVAQLNRRWFESTCLDRAERQNGPARQFIEHLRQARVHRGQAADDSLVAGEMFEACADTAC